MELELTLPVIAAIGSGAALLGAASVFGMRKIILMGQFSYHNARLSTVGNPYVTREEVLPLLDIKDPSTLLKSIQGDLSIPDDIRSFREADRVLMVSFHRVIDDMAKDTPKVISPLVRSFMVLWEVEELKRLLRLVGKRSEPLYPIGILGEDLERQFLQAQNLGQAVELLEGQRVNKAIAPLIRDSEVDLEEIDSVMDRFVLDNFMEIEGLPLSSRRGSKAIAHLLADRYNIQLIIRSKMIGWGRDETLSHLYGRGGTVGMTHLEQMVDSSSLREALSILNGTHLEVFFKEAVEKGPAAVESGLDKMLLEGSIGLSHSYGSNVGPTIRYLVSKEMELKNIRTLVQASFAGWDHERSRNGLILEGGVQ
ncbi:MAG: V-type ATPase subunit [Thermoplasmatota archaeon]